MDFTARSKDHHNHQQSSNDLEGSQGLSADNEGATDDEQEDLPYDGILECYLVPSLEHDLESNSGVPSDCPEELTESLEESLPVNISTESATTSDETVYSLDNNSETISKLSEAKEDTEHNRDNLFSIPTIIPDVLLRHFNEDSLINAFEFIEHETMPEISIAESSDETVISRKSCTKYSQYGLISDQMVTDFEEESLEIFQNENTGQQEDISFNEVDSDTCLTSPKENVPEYNQGGKELCDSPTDNMDKEVQHLIQDQERRLSSSEIKYGQGQVHYKLPDFSKIPPKVKIPKGDAGNIKPAPSIKRTTPSSNLSGQSFVIQDILDSMQPFTEHGLMKDRSIFSDHLHVQVSHYASDSKSQNNHVVPPTTDVRQPPRNTDKESEDSLTGIQGEDDLQTCKLAATDRQSQITEEAQALTEGEKMSRVLMEQVLELKNKVESFSTCIFLKALSTKEELLVFQNLRSCLESLELNYLSTKDKHRNLQLQTYRTGCQTVGEFDLEREVEGQIYRLGMLLEDIQEQINKNEESLTESPPSIKPHQASVSSHAEEPEDTTNMKNSFTERDAPIQEEKSITLLPCLWSLNSTAPNQQIPEQEPPLEKNGRHHSYLTEFADATDKIKNSVTEMVVTSQEEELMDLLSCSTSLNSTALEIQIKQEPPLEKNETDTSHLLQSYQSSLTSPSLKISKTSELSYKSMITSPDQLARRHTYVTSMDHVSPAKNFLSTTLFQQSNMSQRQSSTVLHYSDFSGKSGYPEKKKTLERLRSGIDHNPLFHTSYPEVDQRITQPVCPGKLSVCIQEKALNVEIPVCNERTDSLSSDWLVTSNSQISKYRHQLSIGFTPVASSSPSWNTYRNGKVSARNHSKLLNPNSSICDKALHKQKSYGTTRSRITVHSQNQVSLANQLDFSQCDTVSQFMPLSRYSARSSASRQSQLAAPHTSNLQRKCWSGLKESPLEYNDFKILNSVLDQALRTAKNMQKTTENIIQKLTADLVSSTFQHTSCTDKSAES